ncbi:MAG: hypothetical protein GXP08_13615 [Gammaproteobacteria bacterium]|nr:hypothetical protein [Gammaproteobacteria bacterium]
MKVVYRNKLSVSVSKRPGIVLISLSMLIVGILFISTAQAIPAFARKHQTECSSCHSAWPALNTAGRTFKENGYRLSRDETPGFMNWDQTLPVTAMIKGRPYEKKDSGDKKLRALHEVEVMVAGAMANNFSGWFELEAEDDAGFNVEVVSAALGYHPSEAVNLQVSWGAITGSDPYDVYSNGRKLTRNRASVINQRFGGADADGRLRDARQNITLYGRPAEKFFYSVGISGVKGDAEGEDSDALTGRLAMDVTPEIMIGLMTISGTCKATNTNCTVDRDFSRTGVDAQADIGNIRLMGALLKASDDNSTATAEEDNNATYVEARYTFIEDGRPTFVPLLRLDRYEKNNGQDDYDEITLQVAYYFAENARGFVEYWDVSGPASADDDSLVTLQVEVAF